MKSLRVFILLALLLAPVTARAVSWKELLLRDRPAPTRVFHYGAAKDQFAELWLPKGQGPFPVVAMIHGGCWQESLPGVELMAGIADDLRRHGVAVWNIEYRREGVEGAGYPGTFLDIADALEYLQRIGIDHGLDLAHVVTLGHSAGGQLALWAAARDRFRPASPLYRKHLQKIQAVISIAGIADLAAYREHGPSTCGVPDSVDALVADKGKNSYADTSPAVMLPLHVPQLVISGGDDEIVAQAFGDAYADAAKKAGDEVEVLDIPGADHMDLIDPQSAAWAQIRAALMPYLSRKR